MIQQADRTLASPWLDPSRDTDERVHELLSRMTLDEKLAQLGSVWSFELLEGTGLALDRARGRLGVGIGQVTRPGGGTNLRPREVATFVNELQRFLVEETRLGIPAILHEETLHGVMARGATCYPQALGQAATWEPGLVEQMAGQIGLRLRATGVGQALAPIFDVARDPRWGRIEETFGEDPYLIASLGCAYVRGVQAVGLDGRAVLATGKHMVGHGLPEGGFNQGPSHIGSRELRDVFLWPFEAAVRTSGLGSMMHAYDDVDGVPCVASRELFRTLLRDRWGFEGIVVSDYIGISHLQTLHRMVDDLGDAAAITLDAGIDVELPVTAAYGEPLEEALASGRIDPARVDEAVARVLRAKFQLGLFDQPYVNPGAADDALDGERAVALEIARKSIVLVRNEGILPLRRDLRTIAVIGPNADSARNLVGDYAHLVHIETLLEGRARAGVGGVDIPAALQVLDELAGLPTILDAIREHAPTGTTVRYATGTGILDGDDEGIAEAVTMAKGADVAIVVLGEKSGLTEDCTCGEFRDRMDIGLPGRQAELFGAVAATGVPIVLVLVAGRPLAVPAEAERSAAVVLAWVPGEAGPEAVADVLFGTINPGGKLPITVPRHVGQVPSYYAHKPSGGRSQPRGEYVDGSNQPLWPFGFGLSYTTFEVSDLALDRREIPPDGEVSISASVMNVGDRAGDEVVQLYVRDEQASVTRPVKELRGFCRLRLDPGQRRTVTFRLAAEQLAFTGPDGRLVVEPGRVRVMVGSSSEDLPLQADLEIVGESVELDSRTRYFTDVSVS
jgi:beta-glucosidase